jgi:two-component system response regulator FixJ
MHERPDGHRPHAGTAFGLRNPGGVMARTICIVHPSKEACRQLAETLASDGIETRTFESAEDFLRQVGSGCDGCVVAPSNLPGMGTRALIERIRERSLPLRVVVLGHDADVATAVELVRAGAAEYVEPPALPRRLRAAVRNALAALAT